MDQLGARDVRVRRCRACWREECEEGRWVWGSAYCLRKKGGVVGNGKGEPNFYVIMRKEGAPRGRRGWLGLRRRMSKGS